MNDTATSTTTPELESARRVLAALRAYDDAGHDPGSMEDRMALAVVLRALDGHDAGYIFGFDAVLNGRTPVAEAPPSTGRTLPPPTEAEARAIVAARCDDGVSRPDGWLESLTESLMAAWREPQNQADIRILRAGIAIGRARAMASRGRTESPGKSMPAVPHELDEQLADMLTPQDLGDGGVVQLDPTYVRAVGVVLKAIVGPDTGIPTPVLYATPEATIRAEWSIRPRDVVVDIGPAAGMNITDGVAIHAFAVDVAPPGSVDEATFSLPHDRGVEPVVEWLRRWVIPPTPKGSTGGTPEAP